MADLNTKYLDYTGLGIFLSKLKEYIENRISEINGTNLNLRASGEDNPTLTSQIEDLWAAIGSTDGSGGSIIENIEKILGEYVKSISTPTEQSLPLKLVITEGTEDNKDRFTIELQDNGLNDTLSTLTSARVSKITPANDGGAVTLTVDNNTGDVQITVNSKALTERIETLESRSGKYNARSGSNGYLLVGTGNGNNSDWCSINASKLRYNSVYDGCELSAYGKMAIGTDFYGGICLGTLPDGIASYINIAPNHPFKGINIGSDNINIGSDNINISSGNINIGASFASMGTVQIGYPGKYINLKGDGIVITGDGIVITGNEIIIGTTVRIGSVIVGTSALSDSSGFPNNSCIEGNLLGTAENSLALGSQPPSYYAKKSELNTLSESVSSIDARVTTNTTNISNEVTARQNADNALDERLDTIENSYVKSVKVTGTNGITATPTTATNGDVSISISGQELKESVEALGKVVNLTGVYAAGTALNTISGNDGDFIIVGQKEYVYWNTATTGVDGTKWVLLGDTTQLSQDVSNLTASYNEHKHSVTAKGTIENTFVGGTDTTKSISGSTEVSYISEAGTLPTKSIVEVASDKHTHTTSVTAKGTIENSFTGEPNAHNHNFVGNQNTTSSTGLTISYASGKLTITSAHTHTVTPTGTISDKTITPTGTVTSTFIGEAVSATSGNPSATKEIGSITNVGTLPTYTTIEVASKEHTHTITPTGAVTSTFKGEAVDTSTKK